MADRSPWIDRLSDRLFERSFEESFRGSVEAFRVSEGVSARAFGLAALGDADFIAERLGRGDTLRLDTVDAVLLFMDEPPYGRVFGCEVDAYLAITGVSAYRLGRDAVGDGSFVRRLRAGDSPLLSAVDRVRRWMGKHSSSAQRRAIAAATVRAGWWWAGAAEGPVQCQAGSGCTGAGHLPPYVDTDQAARIMGLSPRTLERKRMTGEGPAYFKLGSRVVYAVSEIERWVQARRRYSTRGGDRAGPRRGREARRSKNASSRQDRVPPPPG